MQSYYIDPQKEPERYQKAHRRSVLKFTFGGMGVCIAILAALLLIGLGAIFAMCVRLDMLPNFWGMFQ